MHKVKYWDRDGKERTRIEGGNIVATYRGRYNPVEKSNRQAWLLIKLFNAFTYVERSKPSFVNYMKRNGHAEKYLAKESDVQIFKEMNHNAALSSSQYGFIINSANRMLHILKSYAKEYFSTEFDRITHPETGETIKIITGIDKTDDYWTLEEYIKYKEKDGRMVGNYDRFVSHAAAITIGKFYEDSLALPTVIEQSENKKPEEPKPRQSVNLLGSGVHTNLLGGGRKRPRSLI